VFHTEYRVKRGGIRHKTVYTEVLPMTACT